MRLYDKRNVWSTEPVERFSYRKWTDLCQTFPCCPCRIILICCCRFMPSRRIPPRSPSSSPPTSPKQRKASLADDITIVGGNATGIFISHVRADSPAEQYGLKEGSELLEVCVRTVKRSRVRVVCVKTRFIKRMCASDYASIWTFGQMHIAVLPANVCILELRNLARSLIAKSMNLIKFKKGKQRWTCDHKVWT